jgi:hypothetical protein
MKTRLSASNGSPSTGIGAPATVAGRNDRPTCTVSTRVHGGTNPGDGTR